MEKAIVIINEQHSIMRDQERVLKQKFDEVELFKVPAKGWTLAEQKEISLELSRKAKKEDASIVFLSPIPFLLKDLTLKSLGWAEFDTRPLFKVLVFHNDNREKKELPNGKVINVVAKEGWTLA